MIRRAAVLLALLVAGPARTWAGFAAPNEHHKRLGAFVGNHRR